MFKTTTEKLQTVEAQIEEAQARRLALAAERESKLPDAVSGDADAAKAVDRIDKMLDDMERRLSTLHDGHAALTARQEAEAAATRHAEAQARIKAAKRIAARRLDLLAELEQATAQVAELIAEINTAGVEMMAVAYQRPRFDMHPANPGSTLNAIRVGMYGQGMRWVLERNKPMQDTLPTMAEAVAKLDEDFIANAERTTHD